MFVYKSSKIHRMTVEYNDSWITEMEWNYLTFYKGAFFYFLTFVKNSTNPPADINSTSFSVTFIVLTGRDGSDRSFVSPYTVKQKKEH